jgi:transposase
MMPRTRAPYPAEYRKQMLALVQAGRTPQELAQEFEPTEQTIRTWIKQAAIDGGERRDGPTTEEKQELARLRKEVRQLRLERDILAKAAAWFARETDSVPPKSSSS